MSTTQHPAVVALITLENRLARVCAAAREGEPVSELLDALRRMPEWNAVRMALPATVEETAQVATPELPAPYPCPNLMPVIEWLENGSDPKEAAQELRVYQHLANAAGNIPVEPDTAPEVEVQPDTIDRLVVNAFYDFRAAMKKERGGRPGTMPFSPLEAFTAGMQARTMMPAKIGHIPPGWIIERLDVTPYKYISIKAPNGAFTRVSNVDRSPYNLLYMLTDSLLNTHAAAADEVAAPVMAGARASVYK